MLLLCNTFVFICVVWASNVFAHTPIQSPQHSHISSEFDWDAYLNNDMNETVEIMSPLASSITAQGDQMNQQNKAAQSHIPEKAKKPEKKRIYSEQQLARKKVYQKQWYIEKKKKIQSLPQSKQDAIKEADKLRRQILRAKRKELTGYTSKRNKMHAELRELIMNGKATAAQETQWQEQKERARKARKRKSNMNKTL